MGRHLMAYTRAQIQSLADRIAQQQGINPRLFRSLIQAESGWSPTAGSPAGARGLTQLMPGTARGLGVTNILDPVQNLTGGAKYLAQQLKAFGGDQRLALAAYNAGPGAVRKYGGIPPFRETQDYVKRVLGAVGTQAGGADQSGMPGVPGLTTQLLPGSIDGKALMALLQRQTQRALAGQMPEGNYRAALTKLAQSALPRARMVGDIRNVGALAGQGGQAVGQSLGGFTMGGGPGSHASRALGNWQSDDAYDLMGKAGQPVVSTVAGRVSKISGKPGGRPGFAGYGITIETPQGKLFYKHLGSTPLRVGAQIRPGTLIGTLDAKTAGGPHLHLGGTNRDQIAAIARAYAGSR